MDLYRTDRDTLADRTRCLEAIVRDAVGSAERLVIEREESTYDHDRRTLHAAILQRKGYGLSWALMIPKLDPLLWIPDGVAWSWSRGGMWRRRVATFCQERDV
ncbi:hypothetical protein [Kribbella karoonensis]|uniref:Uncharacterized protein n=1 Tax=Kribbella karoonensis TaxID=324851 RepID=A0ABP4PAE9_9ACTN